MKETEDNFFIKNPKVIKTLLGLGILNIWIEEYYYKYNSYSLGKIVESFWKTNSPHINHPEEFINHTLYWTNTKKGHRFWDNMDKKFRSEYDCR